MGKSIAIIATLDTKGEHIEHLKKRVEARGHQAIVIDVGILGTPSFTPTITRNEVAEACGSTLEEIIALDANNTPADRRDGMDKMGEGASEIVKQLYAKDELDGVVIVGGSQGTSLALIVTKALPLGLPKLILSTIAFSSVITPDLIGGDDVMMLPWPSGMWGFNSLSQRIIETAAGAICGAAEEFNKKQIVDWKKKIVGASGSGFTKFYPDLKLALVERGYELAVFHFTGMNTRLLERAIIEGSICAVLDLIVGPELADELFGGCYSGGAHRLEAAGKMGIPQIVCPGGVATRWSVNYPVPAQYADRENPPYNRLHSTMWMLPEEHAAVGKLMAEKLNKAKGPTTIVFPMPPKAQSEPYISAEALREAFMKVVKPHIKVVLLENCMFGEPKFVNTILTLFDEMMPA